MPTIDASSRTGRAGTWIGAQAPGSYNSGPFIQIGTNEERDSDLEAGGDYYYAFWSDTAHDFHPVRLFGVLPGDRVSASIRFAHGRWTLALHDAASGVTRRLVTDQETTAGFNEAEYLQEDVTNDETGAPFGYPTLSPVRFSRLTFNGGPVRYWQVESQWMSIAVQHSVAPSSLIGDAFSVRPQMLSAAACRYLDAVTPLNSAWTRLSSLDGTSSIPQLRAAAHAFSTQITNVNLTLRRSSWPAAARRPIHALIKAGRALQHLLPALPRDQAAGVGSWEASFARAEAADTTAASDVRRALPAPAAP